MRHPSATPGGKTITDRWSTPQWLFDRLDAEFHFKGVSGAFSNP